jgi:hypothetical protein
VRAGYAVASEICHGPFRLIKCKHSTPGDSKAGVGRKLIVATRWLDWNGQVPIRYRPDLPSIYGVSFATLLPSSSKVRWPPPPRVTILSTPILYPR